MGPDYYTNYYMKRLVGIGDVLARPLSPEDARERPAPKGEVCSS
jgi:hypothetical protein